MLSLFASALVAASPLALDVDVLAPLSPTHEDRLYVLGFSRDGLFATLSVSCGDESGYECYAASVVDLATDRAVDSIAYDNEQKSSPDIDLIRFGAQVVDMLARHGIDVDAPARFVAGSTFVAEQTFVVRVPDAGGNVTLTRTSHNTPNTKTIAVVRGTSYLDTPNPTKLVGVALSPFERRAAVLVAEFFGGGCGGQRPRVHVIGADLDARF